MGRPAADPTASRRRTLACVAAALLLAGCLGRSPESGDLVVRNGTQSDRTVSVQIRKTGTRDEEVPSRDARPDPDEEPLWTRELELDVSAGGRVVREGFVAEPGVFFVEVSVDDLGEASTWFDLYRAADGGVAGGILSANVQENGHVSVGTSHDD